MAGLALCAAPGMEVVRAHRRLETGGLGGLNEPQQFARRELFVGGVESDQGQSSRVCWTTIGTSDSITLA